MRIVAISLLLLAGCAELSKESTVPVGSPGSGESDAVITFATSACFGTCPVFSFTIAPDGKGVFVGEDFVAVEGKREFTANPDELAAFHKRIAPFRPSGDVQYDWENCSGELWTDMPSVEVTWSNDGETDRVYWYLGCKEPNLEKITPDLYGAWEELPLKDLVGGGE